MMYYKITTAENGILLEINSLTLHGFYSNNLYVFANLENALDYIKKTQEQLHSSLSINGSDGHINIKNGI